MGNNDIFNSLYNYCIERKDLEIRIMIDTYGQLIDKQQLFEIILDTCGKPIVYLINEKRLNNELTGLTPEERYLFFENEWIKNGKAYSEIESRFPSIINDFKQGLKNYFNLIKEIEIRFEADKELLYQKRIYSKEK